MQAMPKEPIEIIASGNIVVRIDQRYHFSLSQQPIARSRAVIYELIRGS